MSNNLTSNVSTKVAKIFAKNFQALRTVSKTVNTQVIQGMHGASTGATVYLKRPHQYNAISTSDGDIHSETKSSIISGRIPATVQNYITVALEWTDYEESLQLDQLDEIIKPAAETAVISLESKLQEFAVKNLGLCYGTVGTLVDAWADVAGCSSLMDALGVPQGSDRYYIHNPFTSQLLAGSQYAAMVTDRKADSAWEEAQLTKRVGGMLPMVSNTLYSWTNGTCADLAGALNATPTATYAGAKDTMTQSIALKSLSAAGVITAGSVIEYNAKYMRNPRTGELIRGVDGAYVKFRQTVVTGVTLDGSGIGTITVTPAAIYESGGQYNNVSAALAEDDVVTILGASATGYSPNLFYHKDALGLATIKLSKLQATDTIFTTQDGISVRVCKYSSPDYNLQQIRFDILPAFAVINPMFGGKSFGL